MSELAGKLFVLIENSDGHALDSTRMQFAPDDDPARATYSGPNVVYGQAIVSGENMLYHALAADGQIAAGRAKVAIHDRDGVVEMVLHWQWLTGEMQGGISKWRQICV